ncbi:MAG: hypothetical protein PF508_08030 [Spirochaeta sp.]|jgi:alginate O-acetyltransferase complex protein AlgJ|nr:hypothetical protein [Spirochaeta sp.]
MTKYHGTDEHLTHTAIAGVVFLLVLLVGVALSIGALRGIVRDRVDAGAPVPAPSHRAAATAQRAAATFPGVATLTSSGNAGLLHGEWTVAFQTAYEEYLPITEPALHLWSAARYRLFRAGTSGVEVGRDGWLFTTEELRVRRGDTPALQRSIATITTAVTDLQRRGAVVVIALVPAKARIYADKLPGYSLPPAVSGRYEEALTALQSIPEVIVPNLRKPLHAARATYPEEPVYLRRDTHWTPRGAAIVAQEIAAAAAASITDDVPRTRFRTERTGTEPYAGDLLRFLPVGDRNASLGLTPEPIDRFTTEALETSGGLFGDPVIPGALVGTSYSAGEAWNFAGFLTDELELDMVSVAEEGQGPFAPMEVYLAGDTVTTYPPQVVVWEIPERYLTDPPDHQPDRR